MASRQIVSRGNGGGGRERTLHALMIVAAMPALLYQQVSTISRKSACPAHLGNSVLKVNVNVGNKVS